jgi:hypothetical protein
VILQQLVLLPPVLGCTAHGMQEALLIFQRACCWRAALLDPASGASASAKTGSRCLLYVAFALELLNVKLEA